MSSHLAVTGPSLGSLLRDHVEIAPHQAVALVDELCRARTQITAVAPFAPLDAVIVGEFGGVARLARVEPDERGRVVEAALALRAMLPDAGGADDSPAAAVLREVALRFLRAARDASASLATFAAAIAPFRHGPSRASVLDLHQRWRARRDAAAPRDSDRPDSRLRAARSAGEPSHPRVSAAQRLTVVDISGDEPLPWDGDASPGGAAPRALPY